MTINWNIVLPLSYHCATISSSSSCHCLNLVSPLSNNRFIMSHSTPCHLWTTAVDHHLHNYYHHRGVFLCPDCLTLSSSYTDFLANHSNASVFTLAKKNVYQQIMSSRPKSTSGQTSNDTPSGMLTII